MTFFPYMPDELIAWLEREFTGVIADTVTGDLESRIGAATWLVRVNQLPSPANEITQFARVDLEVFGVDRAGTLDKARQIHDALSPRTVLDTVTIDTVRTDALPHEIPWPNAKVRRFLATYQISTRS